MTDATTSDTGTDTGHAERIGPFRVLQVLGEGGMGLVYEAEETGPVRRRVALKVLRYPQATRDVVARFETEQQALALMNHPGIAKVLSAGTTEAGRPWFAMELVRGLPITQFCDEQRLPLRERLELFVDVCHAVQHAHQKGLIHRDIKPSNILVARVDGRARPCVIDFGIAKALGRQLTDKTLVTQLGQPIGTAAYMSPEQAESGNLDVDTRTDVYSLGVVLYELLVGRLPVDPASVGIHVFLARLMAREESPPTPSVRLADAATDPKYVAYARRTDPERLRRELKGDLDWIVLRAMEPDRDRRYQTVNALAMDIQRHLALEPIVARPPSAMYRLGRLVQRHRIATAAGVLAAIMIVMGAVVSYVGMVRAVRAERRAAEEAATAREATAFLADIFRPPLPSPGGAEVTARELLDRGAQRTALLAQRPALRSELLHAIGSAYAFLGVYPEARRLLDDALALRIRQFGPRDTLVAQTLGRLGQVAGEKGDYDDAERFLLGALEIETAAHPRDHPAVIGTTAMLADLRLRQGRYPEADSLYALALGSISPRSALAPGRRARILTGLANVRLVQRRPADAEPLLRQSISIQERELGDDNIELAAGLNSLAMVYSLLGRYADALPIYQRTRRMFEGALPADHPYVAASLSNLGETYWKLRRFGDAEPLLRRALESKERVLTPTNPSVAVTLNALAGVLRDERRYADAEPYYQRALAIRRAAFGPRDATTRETATDYAALLRATGRLAEAEGLVASAAPSP